MAASHAHVASEQAAGELRTILDEALDRIRSEVFRAGTRPGSRPGEKPGEGTSDKPGEGTGPGPGAPGKTGRGGSTKE